MKQVSLLSLTLAICFGGLADRSVSLYLQARERYTVRVAGRPAVEDSECRTLADAEDLAHTVAANPETEQEKGRVVLILNRGGQLVAEVTP